jgi:molybdenum-dependent DNA-binding transcriptional regulator ModE
MAGGGDAGEPERLTRVKLVTAPVLKNPLTTLLAELSRLRAFAIMMTNDEASACRAVLYTAKRAMSHQSELRLSAYPRASLFAILRNQLLGFHMSMQELKIFELVASSGSMSDAGRTLGISPAVVSKRICALEDRLATRLFCRPTARLELTDSGRVFQKRIKATLPDVGQALRLVSTSDNYLK